MKDIWINLMLWYQRVNLLGYLKGMVGSALVIFVLTILGFIRFVQKPTLLTSFGLIIVTWTLVYLVVLPLLAIVHGVMVDLLEKWASKFNTGCVSYPLMYLGVSYGMFWAASLLLPGIFIYSYFPLWHLIIGAIYTVLPIMTDYDSF